MSNDKKNNLEEDALMTVKAINLTTKEVIAIGTDGEEVIRVAQESGEEYILDFETNANYNFIL